MQNRSSIWSSRWANSSRLIAAALLTLGLTSSISVAQNPSQNIILPDSKLIGCKASTCSRVMPDTVAGSHAVYPWQVSVDITDGAIIGLTALYDPSTPIDLIKASIDERYGRWAVPGLDKGPVKLWRIEPERFVISLSTDDNGMISVIYLALGAKHPASPLVPCLQYLGRPFQQNPCSAGPENREHKP